MQNSCDIFKMPAWFLGNRLGIMLELFQIHYSNFIEILKQVRYEIGKHFNEDKNSIIIENHSLHIFNFITSGVSILKECKNIMDSYKVILNKNNNETFDKYSKWIKEELLTMNFFDLFKIIHLQRKSIAQIEENQDKADKIIIEYLKYCNKYTDTTQFYFDMCNYEIDLEDLCDNNFERICEISKWLYVTLVYYYRFLLKDFVLLADSKHINLPKIFTTIFDPYIDIDDLFPCWRLRYSLTYK